MLAFGDAECASARVREWASSARQVSQLKQPAIALGVSRPRRARGTGNSRAFIIDSLLSKVDDTGNRHRRGLWWWKGPIQSKKQHLFECRGCVF